MESLYNLQQTLVMRWRAALLNDCSAISVYDLKTTKTHTVAVAYLLKKCLSDVELTPDTLSTYCEAELLQILSELDILQALEKR